MSDKFNKQLINKKNQKNYQKKKYTKGKTKATLVVLVFLFCFFFEYIFFFVLSYLSTVNGFSHLSTVYWVYWWFKYFISLKSNYYLSASYTNPSALSTLELQVWGSMWLSIPVSWQCLYLSGHWTTNTVTWGACPVTPPK